MTKFIDGPAQGQTLLLKRGPRFLRVVEQDGKWDALDQLEDEPEPGESIHVYEAHGPIGSCHLNISGGRGGWFIIGEYRHLPEQPTEEQKRVTRAWREWCEAHREG